MSAFCNQKAIFKPEEKRWLIVKRPYRIANSSGQGRRREVRLKMGARGADQNHQAETDCTRNIHSQNQSPQYFCLRKPTLIRRRQNHVVGEIQNARAIRARHNLRRLRAAVLDDLRRQFHVAAPAGAVLNAHHHVFTLVLEQPLVTVPTSRPPARPGSPRSGRQPTAPPAAPRRPACPPWWSRASARRPRSRC